MATKTNYKSNGKDYYRIRRTVGHKDGKPVVKAFYGSSKGDAEQQYKRYLQQQATNYIEPNLTTFHERAEEYISSALAVTSKYAQGTKTRYISAYENHIRGSIIDSMVAVDIKASDIQKFYNSLDVSKATLKNINKYMSSMYAWMTLNDYAANVLNAVEMPIKKDTSKHDEIVVWDVEEWNRLKSTIFDFRHDFLIKLLCYTGMRISECLALKYSDIADNIIHVRRQYYLGEIKEPKYNSKRDIPMHKNLIEAYLRHLESYPSDDYVFLTESGRLYDIANLRRAFSRFYKREGFTPMGFHVYRATFCTELCRAGAPLEVASKILGHKSLEVTATHYALVKQDSMVDAINLLD